MGARVALLVVYLTPGSPRFQRYGSSRFGSKIEPRTRFTRVRLRPMSSKQATSVHPTPFALAPPAPELRGFPLGTVLLRLGFLPAQTVDAAIAASELAGQQLGRYLVEHGQLSEDALAFALATQKGLPYVDVASVTPDPRALVLLSAHAARTLRTLPLGFMDERPVVAVANPTCATTVAAVQSALGSDVVIAAASPPDVTAAIVAAYFPAQSIRAPVPVIAPPVRVLLGLCTGEQLVVDGLDAAKADQLLASMRAPGAAWPCVDGRFLRPGAIVSAEIAA
jgi:hypothetical protein